MLANCGLLPLAMMVAGVVAVSVTTLYCAGREIVPSDAVLAAPVVLAPVVLLAPAVLPAPAALSVISTAPSCPAGTEGKVTPGVNITGAAVTLDWT